MADCQAHNTQAGLSAATYPEPERCKGEGLCYINSQLAAQHVQLEDGNLRAVGTARAEGVSAV
jgi:hypothetical protein